MNPDVPRCKNFLSSDNRIEVYDNKNITKIRKERAIGAITLVAGGLALAGSDLITSTIMNSGKIHDIESHVEAVNNKINDVVRSINIHSTEINRIGKRLDNITTLVLPQILNDINELLQSVSCSNTQLIAIMLESISWLSSLPARMIRIINSAYDGRVTPDILRHNMIAEIMEKRPDLAQSIYKERPDMIYESANLVIL